MARKNIVDASNYAVSHRDQLQERHYVLNSATHKRRWVAFAPGQVAAYRARHGDDFCLVIAGDPTIPSDFYAIPWRQVSELFVTENIYPAPSKARKPTPRWQMHLEGTTHVFQLELAKTDDRPRPRFDASGWYANYAALGISLVDDQTPLAELLTQHETFPEGRQIVELHHRRERNPVLVQRSKSRFRGLHGRLFCEVCGFDFHEAYQALGDGYIEAHHTVPLRSLTEQAETRIEDLAMVCANCHRMLHRGERWLGVPELAAIVGTSRRTRQLPVRSSLSASAVRAE